jgi:hypothetical protein
MRQEENEAAILLMVCSVTLAVAKRRMVTLFVKGYGRKQASLNLKH